jgi:hypothetical protein
MRDLAAARAASARRLPIALGAESGVGGALLKTLQPLGDNVRGGVAFQAIARACLRQLPPLMNCGNVGRNF